MSRQEPVEAAGTTIDPRLAELRATLADDIDLARLAPGQAMSFQQLANRLRCNIDQTRAVAESLVGTGLLTLQEDGCLIAPIRRENILPQLDRRLVLEQQIAAAAALNLALADRAVIKELALLLKRSAMVGDLDGYMAADRRLEKAIAIAADLPDVAQQVFTLKREFRRAWCAHNRLRDLNVPAGLRQALVDAVLAGKPEEAKAAVKSFIEYLGKSY
jgi:DNA-binding GntR family transcriptional regulator